MVRVHAGAEIDEAFEWYRARSPQAATDFLAVVDGAFREIAEDPSAFRWCMADYAESCSRDFHTPCFCKRYPRTISIVGVIHGHRHPDTWLSRAGP